MSIDISVGIFVYIFLGEKKNELLLQIVYKNKPTDMLMIIIINQITIVLLKPQTTIVFM